MQAFRHSPGTLIIHALLVAMLCSLPQWIGVWQNHGDYSPFSVSPAVSAITFDETHAYAPPARRLFSTGKLRAEVDNYENRNLSAGIPFVPTAILGGMGWALGSLERSFIAADLIFPALLFVLFYAIAATVVQDSILRLLVAWSTVIVPFGVLNSIWIGDDARIAPLELTRTPQPEISFFVLILAAALLGRAIEEESDWRLDPCGRSCLGCGRLLLLLLCRGLECNARTVVDSRADLEVPSRLDASRVRARPDAPHLRSLRGSNRARQRAGWADILARAHGRIHASPGFRSALLWPCSHGCAASLWQKPLRLVTPFTLCSRC